MTSAPKLPLEPWQAELVARSVCEQMGWPPMERVVSNGQGYFILHDEGSPRWAWLVDDIQQQAATQLALRRYIG